ncbi:MAG: hypothetical protein H6748_21765, partial [Spirochaetaceae bacterium]|nr:hypothetical protein [Spirochaetaceae bacterium]
MRTASLVRRNPRRRPIAAIGLGLALLAASGCLARRSIVVEELLLPIETPKPWLPEAADLAAVRLGRAALLARPGAPHGAGSDASTSTATPAVESALAALLAAPASERNDDLAPLAIDLRNATLDDPIADRAASRALRRRRGLDPRLATRLDEIVGDDPLRLARSRQRDDWHLLWARTFNSISEPLGSTAITGFVLAPYTLANSFIHYFAEFSNAEPLSQTGRQALSLRREFLERHPDSPLAPELARRVDRDAIKLEKTLAMRRVRAGEDALEAGEARLARHHARAALDLLEPHPDANARLRRRAIRLAKASDAQTATRDRLLTRSLEVRPPTTGSVDSETSPAAIALAARVIAAPLAPGTLENELAAYRRVAGDRGRA